MGLGAGGGAPAANREVVEPIRSTSYEHSYETHFEVGKTLAGI